ncbi:MAG: hypothetical protein LAN84_15585 [Acidobacteriia bacterium]|nr:hypothetical protein [Terriglobia bacterium]
MMDATAKTAFPKIGRIFAITVGGTGVGVGIGLMKMLFDLYKSDRAIGLQVIDSAPLVVILMFAMCLWFLQTDRQIDVTRDTAMAMGEMAAANRELAVAVKDYTSRDSARAEAQDAALRYLAGNTDLILSKIKEMEKRSAT